MHQPPSGVYRTSKKTVQNVAQELCTEGVILSRVCERGNVKLSGTAILLMKAHKKAYRKLTVGG
jgi:hypothetical protein